MENVMEMTNGFAELSAMELYDIDGGGWQQVLEATTGGILLAHTPFVATLAAAGMIASGGPAIVVCAVGGTGLLLKACGY